MYFAVYTSQLSGVACRPLWLSGLPQPSCAAIGLVARRSGFGCFPWWYLASRAVTLPGLVALTGRWDFAPGTFAGALALGFVAVHMSVLLGINVAYPQRQQWSD